MTIDGKSISDEEIRELRDDAKRAGATGLIDLCDLAMTPDASCWIPGVNHLVSTREARERCASFFQDISHDPH